MQISDNIPQDERWFRHLELGWRSDLLHFVQYGLPQIVFAVLLGVLAQAIVSLFVNRMRSHAASLVGNSQRAAQLRTIAGIIRATSYAVIGFYILTQILGAIGVGLGPFIASAGVIGLGISFGAQSIFKDMLNGLFILIEDQYNVGDVVKLASLTGSVEDLTLRVTKLRDGDGTLYIIPNSQITTVSNLSRDFSVATLSLSVDTREDPDRVVAVLKKLASDVRADVAFKDVVLADPDIPGVDNISGHQVLYPINLRVRANQRDGVLRELRRRILIAFAKENIAFGSNTSALILQKTDPTAMPPATS